MYGSGFRNQGLGCRVQGLGFRVQGLGFRVQGAGFVEAVEEGRPHISQFGACAYMGTSLIRNRHPVGPYSRNMPRLLLRS